MTTLNRLVVVLGFLLLLVPPLVASSAQAVVPAPRLAVDSYALPTNFSAGGTGAYQVTVRNAGSLPTDGSEIVLADILPAGLTAQGIEFYWSGDEENLAGFLCSVGSVECRFPVLKPDETLKMVVLVAVGAKASGALVNDASVTGGGVPAVTTTTRNAVSSAAAPFGPASFSFAIDGVDGAAETQAGGHPYEVTTTFALNNSVLAHGGPAVIPSDSSVQDLKDVVVQLPLGVVASTLAAPECPLSQLSSTSRCPADTIVGHIETEPIEFTSVSSPIYNLVPERGVPGEFGFYDTLSGTHVLYAHVVPTSSGYVLEAVNPDIPAIILRRVTATFYGDPAAKQKELAEKEGKTASSLPPVPYFTNPTNCSGQPLVATIYMDSWQNPAQMGAEGTPVNLEEPQWAKAQSQPSESPPVIGCNSLQFPAEIGAQPTTHESDKPSGLNFEIKIPQTEKVGTAVTPTLKKTTIVFPAGMTVDPSSADGLAGCTDAEIGWLGPDGPNGEPLVNKGLTNFSPSKPECPEASKIGSLELETPLVPHRFEGELFLAAQNKNPFDSIFATYIVVNDPITGVVLKLAGEVQLCARAGEIIDGRACEAPGQITSTFEETPNLPFSDLKAHFFEGPRAEFATPPVCGTYTTNTILEPWSAPDSGPAATPFDTYLINEDCPIGFNPAFTGGSTNLQAGGYSTFQASFERQDSDQEFGGAEVSLPPGLLADISSVTECGEGELKAEEEDAPTGGCPANSKVGTVEAGAGPGPNPLFVPGEAYLTGPHNGGPYGLAVVVSANPGPFHFGNVVVRQSLRINPYTAAVTDVSDEFPTFLDPRGANGQVNGVPIKLRRVDVQINRPSFAFNPTNCAKETFHVGGAITSTAGASKTLATPFQVTNCGHLKFAPKISFSSSGKTSRQNGADLVTKVTYPSGTQGIYSDVGYVKVELPKKLPSRLTTLQQACTLHTFEENAAACPSASKIGYVSIKTPILPGLLTGPAIFVSHGGEAFPTLTMVVQGDGVTIDLIGDTFISGSGITSTTFNTLPDSPFETFELVLPQGPYSALAANGNLCTQKLVLPVVLGAQDGSQISESVPLNVTGCTPEITVMSHRVKGRTATIKVSVPSAGKLTATAKGLNRASKSRTSAGTITLKLTLKRAEAAFLKKHPGRKLAAMIHLTFTPKHGNTLSTTITVSLR